MNVINLTALSKIIKADINICTNIQGKVTVDINNNDIVTVNNVIYVKQ